MSTRHRSERSGIPFEVWRTSFKVQGMAQVVFKDGVTWTAVSQLIDSIHDIVYEQARQKAIASLSEQAKQNIINQYMRCEDD